MWMVYKNKAFEVDKRQFEVNTREDNSKNHIKWRHLLKWRIKRHTTKIVKINVIEALT
jgi:hypothetical protein